MDYAVGGEADLAAYYTTEPQEKKRGQKECPNCGTIVGGATKQCECKHVFYVVKQQKKSKRYKEIDWKGLQPGDIIYVENNDVWVSPLGESLPMGNSGEFLVKKVTPIGLVLYNSRGGYSFQTMIEEGYSKKTGITRGVTKIYAKKNI